MERSEVLAQICIALVITMLLVMIIVVLPFEFSDKQKEDITDIVNISRNIYKVSVQDAEKYLREKKIDYKKQEGQLVVKNVFFRIKDNILNINSGRNGISRSVNLILNADFSDTDHSFSDDETTYYLENLIIIEKDGDFRYYQDGILERTYGVFLFILIAALAGTLLFVYIIG